MISPEDLPLHSTETIASAHSAGTRCCVLLAEDDPALKRYLEIVLERAGYKVVSASDGLEAMKILVSTSVDAVVTDAVMPNLNGHELSRFVRSSPKLSRVPIILLSALDPKNADAEQVNAFLTKPVSPEDLVDCLARLLAECEYLTE